MSLLSLGYSEHLREAVSNMLRSLDSFSDAFHLLSSICFLCLQISQLLGTVRPTPDTW